MTVRPRPWPRGVASSTELSLIKWHKERGGFPLLEIHRQHYGTSKPKKCNMRSFTLRFNRMNSVRVEYAPWSIEGPVPLELKSILPSIHLCPASLLINVRPTGLTQPNWLRKRKPQRPSTPASNKKRRPNKRQVVEDTSEEEAPSKLTTLPTNGLWGGAGEREPTENPNRLTDPFIHTRFIRVGDGLNKKKKKISAKNRASEAGKRTAAQRLGLVSEEFWAWATTHAAARTRNSRRGHQPPESL